MTMRIVAAGGARRKGIAIDEAAPTALEKAIIETFERQQGAVAASSLMLTPMQLKGRPAALLVASARLVGAPGGPV